MTYECVFLQASQILDCHGSRRAIAKRHRFRKSWVFAQFLRWMRQANKCNLRIRPFSLSSSHRALWFSILRGRLTTETQKVEPCLSPESLDFFRRSPTFCFLLDAFSSVLSAESSVSSNFFKASASVGRVQRTFFLQPSHHLLLFSLPLPNRARQLVPGGRGARSRSRKEEGELESFASASD